MKVPHTTFSTSCSDTDNIAINFSKLISPNSIIYLNGDLGSGKTYFAKILAKQFGVYDLSSSSYERVSIHKKQVNLIHCDLYRDDCSNIFLTELDYHLIEPWILILEWPKQYLPFKNCKHFIVNISVLDKNIRSINIGTLTDSEFSI